MKLIDDNFSSFSFENYTLFFKGNFNISHEEICNALKCEVFPDHLRGNFSLIFIDNATQDILFAAVDHFASFPLFYSTDKCSQYFYDLVDETPNLTNDLFFQEMSNNFGNFTIGENTTFNEIKRLQPGHYWCNKQIQFIDILKSNLPEGDYIQDAKQRLTSIIQDTDFDSLSLSGGKDSSVLLHIIKQLNRACNFVSITSPRQIFSERKIINELCEHYNINVAYENVDFSGEILGDDNRKYFSFWKDDTFSPKFLALKSFKKSLTGEIGLGIYSIYPALQYISQCNPSLYQICAFLVDDVSTFHKNKNLFNIPNNDAREHLIRYFMNKFTSSNLSDTNKIMHLLCVEISSFRLFPYSQDKSKEWLHPYADWEFINFVINSSPDLKCNDEFEKIFYLSMFPNMSKIPWRFPKNGLSIPSLNKY